MTNATVIIPARGGSKGLPGKNIKTLCGKPLLAWAIEAALQSEMVEQVYVTTDDANIARQALRFGAKVIDRPVELSGDTASSESALLHALDELSSRGDLTPLLVFMQCTSPLTLASDIDQAIRTLVDAEADTCLTVTASHAFLWRQNPVVGACGVNHDKAVRLRRQDCEPEFRENGAVYVMRTDGFRAEKHRFFGKTVISEMPAKRSVEIDDALDFDLVAVLMKAQLKELGCPSLFSNILGIVFDFDGVMTDNRVITDQHGNESVACDRSDGMGIALLRKAGYKLAVLSTEVNPVVSVRCKKLGVECWQGLGDGKLAVFLDWCQQQGLPPEKVIYVGNDVNDLECLEACGCGVVPADAYAAAKAVAKIVLENSGGCGAVRELCDRILSENK
jgi:N-acylneuraminate cytidylyltransferase